MRMNKSLAAEFFGAFFGWVPEGRDSAILAAGFPQRGIDLADVTLRST